MRFIRSVITQDKAITASDVTTIDLPVNPLSHIDFTLKYANVTNETTLAEALERIDKIEVLYKGAAILSMSGADLYALDCVLLKKRPYRLNIAATDGHVGAITLIVPMGRKLMNPEECFPATKKGELQLQITDSGTETACDTIIYQIETTELLGATPKRHLKATTLSKTLGATGLADLELPKGNKYAGILVYGTTIPTTTAFTATLDYIKLLLDNVEYDYAKANWETLHGNLAQKIDSDAYVAAAAGDSDLAHYALLDFDPYEGSDFLVDTAPPASVKLRYNDGVGDAMRAIPIEIAAA